MQTVPIPCHTADELVDAREAARLLGLRLSSIGQWATDHKVPTVSTRPGVRRATRLIPRSAIDAYLALPSVKARRARTERRPDLTAAIMRHPASGHGPGCDARYPVAPLLRLAELHYGPMPLTQLVGTLGLPRADLALLHRARYDGLTSIAADRISCALGFHPSLVWGMDWWDGAEPASAWEDFGGDAA